MAFALMWAHGLAKDLDRDDLDRWHLAEGDDMVEDGTHPLWDRNEVHEIYREWRRVFDRYNPPRSAVAEAWVLPERQYLYARPSELGQIFNFEFAKATWTYDDMHAAIEEGLKAAIESDSASTWGTFQPRRASCGDALCPAADQGGALPPDCARLALTRRVVL